MATYVFRKEPSTGAKELAEALNGLRWRGTRTPIERKARNGDVVISWGENIPNIPGVKILNGGTVRNKYSDALLLKEKGVSTIEVSQNRPVAAPQRTEPVTDPALALHTQAMESAEEFVDLDFSRNQVYRDGLNQLIERLSALRTSVGQAAPAPRVIPGAVQGNWIGRLRNHVGGNDLLNPPNAPEYFVKRENIVEEFRIHSFLGRSIRAGKKVAREGMTPHEWIRSWDGGWKILYDGVSAKNKHREIARNAVKALGLDFGAVDIGVRADGSLIVLEVNRAPGIEGGTVNAYAAAVQKWMTGEWTADNYTAPAARQRRNR